MRRLPGDGSYSDSNTDFQDSAFAEDARAELGQKGYPAFPPVEFSAGAKEDHSVVAIQPFDRPASQPKVPTGATGLKAKLQHRAAVGMRRGVHGDKLRLKV